MTQIKELETNHYDQITVVDHNLTGKRMLTASADHRVKVYERAAIDSEPVLKDTWTAHNADIRDAKWFHPTLGTHIATISNDLTLKVWGHDPSQAPNSGRTFRRITTISSTTGVPFVSFSIKHIAPATTYLAVIDRIGNLTVYTPASPESFADWAAISKFNVCDGGQPPRTTETCFSVTFDQNVNSVPYILNLPSSSQNIVSLAVSALDLLKIYRSSTTAVQSFYEAARSTSHQSLIRSIAWSAGNVRGYDILATGSADGSVRFFNLNTAASPTSAENPSSSSTSAQQPSAAPTSRHTPQSSLTTAIIGRSSSSSTTTPSVTSAPSSSSTAATAASRPSNQPFTHNLTVSALLEGFHRDCLAVRFDATGNLLASMDADGQTVYWKRSISLMDDGVGDGAETPEQQQGRSEWIVFAREEERESGDEDGGGSGVEREAEED